MRIGVGVETARHVLLRPNPAPFSVEVREPVVRCHAADRTLVKTGKRRRVPMQMHENGLSIYQQLLRCCSVPSCDVTTLHICTQMNTNITAPLLY